MRLICLLTLSLVVFHVRPAVSQRARIPDAFLTVAARQLEGGKLSQGIHVFDLFCYDGQCSLTTTSLNRCFDVDGTGAAFYPSVERTTTEDGSLSVRAEPGRLIVEEKGMTLGSYTITLRFDYAKRGKEKVPSRVTGFSGALVKSSDIAKKLLTVEYVPLPARRQKVHLDCDAVLMGVDPT